MAYVRWHNLGLSEKNRSIWHRDEIASALDLLDVAAARHQTGPHQIKAAISACHCKTETSDWSQILALYRGFLRYEPTPVVMLNHAVAVVEAGRLDAGLEQLDLLAEDLQNYQPFHAARAEFLARKGQVEAAGSAYLEAIRLSQSGPDAVFLENRRRRLEIQRLGNQAVPSS